MRYINTTWASRRPKSLETLFVPELVEADGSENTKDH